MKRHGITADYRSLQEGYKPCDVAVMWSRGKKRFPATMIRDEIVKEHGDKPFIHLERGYLCRDKYDSIGLGGLWGYGDYKNENSSPDRYHQLDVMMLGWKPNPDGHILIIGQVPWDTAVQHVEFDKWVDRVKDAARLAGIRWKFRQHPHFMDLRKKQKSLEEALEGVRCVVTLNSTAAVETILMGVPTICTDPGSMAWPLVGGIYLQSMLDPPMPSRDQFFYNLAYTQWNHEEITRGEAWDHLMNGQK